MKKLLSNKTNYVQVQNELKEQQNKIKITNILSSLFIGQSYFFNDGSQNFKIFQLILNTFTVPADLTEKNVAWQSKGSSNERIRPPLLHRIVFLQN